MENIDVKHVIACLASHLVVARPGNVSAVNPSAEDQEHRTLRDGCYGMYFTIAVDYDNYGYGTDNVYHPEWVRNYRRSIHLIVTERHNVFSYVSHGRGNPVAPVLFENSSNHDSCWREDGLRVVDDVLCDGYQHCFAFLPDECRPAPANTTPLVQFENWHFGKPPFEIVKVKGRHKGDHNYRWSLTEIDIHKFELSVLEVKERLRS
jgi:hypothetical protein